ncbi:MAG TPA: error-prone DNA polymerase [Acidimicrobiales bacterium]|nr:error-prone DNA polymerase [Acidimicrobiales bacterium]
MGWSNPDVPWKELHRRLSDVPPHANGGDSPAWSRKRAPYEAPPATPRSGGRGRTPYAELHCHSNFSFLDGASHPEELVEEAARLDLEALALTDHDGMYGVVRFAEAASAVGMPTIFGAELSLGLTKPQNGVADPEGRHLLVLARDPQGYGRLCRAISAAQLAGEEKGRPVFSLSALAEASAGHWLVLTGCRKGTVPAALVTDGPAAATRQLADLVVAFGRDNVAVELWDHGDPLDSARNDALVDIALRQQVEVVATNNVHYSVPARRELATALAAVRARRSLDEIDGWLPPSGAAHLRSGGEQARRFARYPGVVERAAALGRECAFDLKLVAPNLPDFPVPEGHTEMSWLRHLTEEGAARRYGPRPAPCNGFAAERVPGAYAQIDHELALIEQLDFPGYFLIVWDIVKFCNDADIYCQGRGSAANSAVCYALGITAADAVSLGLLFERFLSPERDGPPDIDVDIESDRREEAIQYVYTRYGRSNAAQVANVITYRPKSAVRDMGKALGYSMGQLDAWSKQVDGWGPMSATVALAGGGPGGGDVTIPPAVLSLASAVEHFPRHLGIHSGGMVICDRPVSEVVPVEWGRMEGRTVLQWDKDDCAAAGLVKFDLLGLGMLSALHYAVDLIRDAYGVEVDLAQLPQEDAVYDMLCEADSVGVFQVESRAQMATLPRLRPRTFYDLVVEVALIRPGPIQGGSVHPYIRRRNGREPVTYLHPLLERSLKKTLGVPLFQEQLMQMAIDVAGFTAGEADQLRQAMGSKRSRERMERLRDRLYEGMAERGITGEVADRIYEKLAAFANFGFPESHSVSFAYLVYSSSWIKLHYPAAFCAALLNAQPMGFYSPQSLVADAKRHGVVVLPPDVNASSWDATLERLGALTPECRPERAEFAVRLGIGSVRSLGVDVAKAVAAGRPYSGMEDVVRAAGLTEPQVEALATAGAFGSLGVDRRSALWAAGAVAQSREGRLPGVVVGASAPALPGMAPVEETIADLWSTSVSTATYPTVFVRAELDALGAVAASGLRGLEHGTRVVVGGVVTHRQRPATAQGTTFINLEDETGLINVVCSKGAWARYRRAARSAPALLVRGSLEKVDGVINVVADRITELVLSGPAAGTGMPRSRDFR